MEKSEELYKVMGIEIKKGYEVSISQPMTFEQAEKFKANLIFHDDIGIQKYKDIRIKFIDNDNL